MEIRVHGRNLDVTDRVRTHAETKVQRAAKFFDRLGDVDVEIQEESNPRPDGRFRAEITTSAAGLTLRTESSGDTIQHAIDGAADRLGSNLRKLNDRLSSRRRGGAKKALNLSSHSAEDDWELDTPEIVRVKQFVMKPMTPEDAALAMEQLGHAFFFFHNADSDLPSVLYHRRDGRLGLIEPK